MLLKSLLPTYNHIEDEISFQYKFTIFTPVYNRSDTLHRVFKSLDCQTYRNFELIIINDGSTDNSHEVISEFIKNVTYKVTYINNELNQHKMACLVQGIQLAKGEFFLPFDSDDECSKEALQVFNNTYNNIPDKKKDTISSVTCLCNDQNGNLVGTKFHENPFFSSTFKNRLSGKYHGEKWGFIKTKILKGFSVNQQIFSKGYIPEGTLWILLSKHNYETVYINDVLRTYYLDTGNRVSNQDHEKDAFGMMIYSLALLNWFYKDYFLINPKIFIKRTYTLLRASQFLDFKLIDYITAIDSFTMKFIFILGWPFKRLFN